MSAAHGGGEALAEALEYVAAGYVVGPVSIRVEDGKKRPVFHTAWQSDPEGVSDDPERVLAWARQYPGCGFHVPCGPNGIVVVDADVKIGPDQRLLADGPSAWRAAKGPRSPMIVTTQSGGEHLHFRAPEEPIRNSAKAIAGVSDVDVRGDGGTVFSSGTRVEGGGSYAATRIVPRDELPELPERWAKRLRDAGPSGERNAPRERPERPTGITAPRLVSASKVKDQAWIEAKVDDELRELARRGPGNFRARLFEASAIVYRAVALGVVSEEEAEERLTGAILRVWDGSPDAEDARWIAEGRQAALADPWRLVTVDPPAPEQTGPAELVEGEDGEREPTTWAPRDLSRFLVDDPAEIEEEPGPVVLARDDGVHLLYRGKVNGLLGESESGKSWVALHAAEQTVTAGGHVLYVDFEDGARGVTGRMRALGAKPSDLRERFAYVSPEEGLGVLAEADLDAALAEREWALIVVDGFNMAMTLLGLDLLSNTDVGLFFARVLRRLSRTGAAVLYVDHVPKNAEARGKGGIGAQQKRALTDGAALRVEVTEAFGRGQTGRLKLTVDKDRPGHVRGVAADASFVGMAVLESDGLTGEVRARIEAASTSGGRREPTRVMEKVSTFLQGSPDHAFTNGAVCESVGGKKAVVLEALTALALRGHITREKGERGAVLNRFASRFSAFVGEVVDALDDPEASSEE